MHRRRLPGGAWAGRECVTDSNQCDGGYCEERRDWIFDGLLPIAAIDVFSAEPDYRFGATLLVDLGPKDPSTCLGGTNDGGPCDGDADCPAGACQVVEFYFGTLILDVPDTANGTFAYGIVPGYDTFLGGPHETDATIHPVPLTIHVANPAGCPPVGACCLSFGECQDAMQSDACTAAGGVFGGVDSTCADEGFCACPTIVDSYPRNCDNDARWPYRPDDCPPSPLANNIGLDSVVVTLSPGTALDLVTPDVFTLRFAGRTVLDPPSIESVEPLDGTDVRVNFTHPLPVQAWTCLGLSCQDEEPTVCWGRLPGDVDNSGVADTTDVLKLIDALNRLIELEPYECDIDHSGVCNATDILAEIDWLNGMGCFIEFTNLPSPGAVSDGAMNQPATRPTVRPDRSARNRHRRSPVLLRSHCREAAGPGGKPNEVGRLRPWFGREIRSLVAPERSAIMEQANLGCGVGFLASGIQS